MLTKIDSGKRSYLKLPLRFVCNFVACTYVVTFCANLRFMYAKTDDKIIMYSTNTVVFFLLLVLLLYRA